jgi:hypothetical protein
MLRHLATISAISWSLWGQAVYHGPKSLGPYTVEHRVSNEALFRILGQPVSTKVDSFCYESSDGNFSLSFDRIADNPKEVGSVLIAEFSLCSGARRQTTQSGPNKWRTEKDIGLGSSVAAVEKAYGKPSAVYKTDVDSARLIFRGDRSITAAKLHEMGQLQWAYKGAIDDASFCTFGIRDGEVVWIMLSSND